MVVAPSNLHKVVGVAPNSVDIYEGVDLGLGLEGPSPREEAGEIRLG